MPSLEQQFYNALHTLKRNYPNSITTWGIYCNDYCDKPARGSGYCADCCEDQIAEIIGDKNLAREIHDATTLSSSLVNTALEEIEEKTDCENCNDGF